MRHPRLRDLAIGHKLVLISLLAAGASLLLSSVGIGIYEYQTAREGAVERLRTVALVTVANSTAALSFENREDARRNLAALGSQKQIYWACFYDSDDALFAGYSQPDAPTACPPSGAGASGHEFASNQLTLTLPAELEGLPIGKLIVSAELLELRGRLIRYLQVLTVVVLASGIVAFLLATRLQRLISQPILTLVDTSRRVSFERDYSIRVEPGGRDEFGLLIESFNEMLEQIQARDWQLECARAELDDEVKERTRELQDAVTELQREVEQRQRAEQRIRFLAYFDVLTGLPNRRLLEHRLQKTIATCNRSGRPAALLFLDLDRFKAINDGFGHATGDLLLREVAERLNCCVRGSDQVSRPDSEGEGDSVVIAAETTVSRQGGDEFTILLGNLQSPHDATRVARRILESMRIPFMIGELELIVATSIGIAIYPDDGDDPETLIKHADTAMYHAKSSGGGDFQYFTADMKVAAIRKLTLESDLREALVREQFFLVYQPRLDLAEGRITGVEALLRWRHPLHGIVKPLDFILVAEESELITEIGAWVLQEACSECASWRAVGFPELRISVNVSSKQLRTAAFVEVVENALSMAGLEAHRLELEVTESLMVEQQSKAVDVLSELRERGVLVALDDFGTGYSSLSYLRRLPLDVLKIDRSFIIELGQVPESESIVSAVITMAQALGLRVVAEGVETPEQLENLRSRNCDEIQGFLISEPVESSNLVRVIDAIHQRYPAPG